MKSMHRKTQNRTEDAGTRAGGSSHFAFFIACLSFFVLPLATSGCGSATVEQPLAQTLGGNDPDKQMEFWHRLADEPVTSNDDAFHALLLFADGSDPAADYAGRVQALKARGLLPGGFDQPANRAVDRGTFSVALAKALRVRGGIVMGLFGASPRYATKELEFAEVYPASSPNQTFSGSEFLAVMSRAEEYQKARQASAPTGGPAYAPPEMELKRGGMDGASGGGPDGGTIVPPATQPAADPAPAMPATGSATQPV